MKISIFGAAGTVGSCTAFVIANSGLADELVLLDVNKDMLNNHVIDISTAVSSMHRITVRAGTNEDTAGSDIAIITAGINFPASTSSGERLGKNLPIIMEIGKSIGKYCPDALVLTATNPVDVFNLALYKYASLERKKLVGYNMNDSVRFRLAAARVLEAVPSDINGLVFGEHPTGQVFLFSTLKHKGRPVPVDEELKTRIRQEIDNYLKHMSSTTSRTAGWTTSTGLGAMVRAIIENSREPLPCSVILDSEYGYRSISIGLSAIIYRTGIDHIPQLELAVDEREQLDRAAEAIKNNANMAFNLL